MPTLVFLLFGGVWADRLPRQRLLISTDLVNFAAQATTAALLLGSSARLWELILLQAVGGTANAFFSPALIGVVPATVPEGRLKEANGLLQLTQSGSVILGGATAGGVVAALGPGWAFAFDAATFALSAVFLLQMRLTAQLRNVRTSVLAELREGWRAFSSLTWLWVVVVQFGFYNALFYGSLFVLGPQIARTSLGGAASWGAILAANGAGTLIGSFVVLRAHPRRPLRAAYTFILFESPVLFLLAAGAPVPLIALAAFVAGMSLSFFTVIWETALQEHVPSEVLSRVSAYDWLGSLALMPIGYLVIGQIGAALGPRTTLWAVAPIAAVSVLLALAVPDIRGLRRKEHHLDAVEREGAWQD